MPDTRPNDKSWTNRKWGVPPWLEDFLLNSAEPNQRPPLWPTGEMGGPVMPPALGRKDGLNPRNAVLSNMGGFESPPPAGEMGGPVMPPSQSPAGIDPMFRWDKAVEAQAAGNDFLERNQQSAKYSPFRESSWPAGGMRENDLLGSQESPQYRQVSPPGKFGSPELPPQSSPELPPQGWEGYMRDLQTQADASGGYEKAMEAEYNALPSGGRRHERQRQQQRIIDEIQATRAVEPGDSSPWSPAPWSPASSGRPGSGRRGRRPPAPSRAPLTFEERISGRVEPPTPAAVDAMDLISSPMDKASAPAPPDRMAPEALESFMDEQTKYWPRMQGPVMPPKAQEERGIVGTDSPMDPATRPSDPTSFMGDLDRADLQRQNKARNQLNELDQRKEDLQRQRVKKDIAQGLGGWEAATTAGSMRGDSTGFKDFDTAGLDQLIAEGEYDTADVADPRSLASQRARDNYEQLFGIKLSEGVSARDVESQGPQVLAQQSESRRLKAATEMAGDRRREREGFQTEKLRRADQHRAEDIGREQRRYEYTADKDKVAQGQKRTKRLQTAVQQLRGNKAYAHQMGRMTFAKEALEAFSADTGAGQKTGMMAIIKAAQDDGRISNEDFRLFSQRWGIKGWADMVSKFFTGKIAPAYKEELVGLIRQIGTSAQKEAKKLRNTEIKLHSDLFGADEGKAFEGLLRPGGQERGGQERGGSYVNMIDPQDGKIKEVDSDLAKEYEDAGWRKK